MSALQKGKKKVEEAATKAKDAITANGHGTEHSKDEDTPTNEQATDGHTDHSDAEPGAAAEPANATASTPEADSSAVDAHTSRPATETEVQ